MKNLLLTIACTLTTTLLFAQTDNTIDKVTDTAGMAKIYLIRSTGYVGSAVNMRLQVDDSVLCKIKNNRHAIFYVQPGAHMLYATTWDKPAAKDKFSLNMTLEPGKSYYFSMRIKQKFMGTEIFLEEITYNTAAPQLQKYKLDECD